MTTTDTAQLTGERADLLASLAKHRFFLRITVRELTEEQARTRTTASVLTLGGLLKHVTQAESNWMRFALGDADAMAGSSGEPTAGQIADYADNFRMLPGDTLESVLASYEHTARRTDDLVRTLPDLDVSYPLPSAPWFEPGARWSIRRVLLHILAETAQHAGHADILRESLDGAKSMG